MKQSDFPDYDEIHAALAQGTEEMHASEVHGLICGLLCGNPQSALAWKETVIAGDPNLVQTEAVLQKLYDETAQQLKEFLFDLRLVLPDDDAELPLRAEALTFWVQGFLTGLKMTHVPLVEREASEVTEAINDMIEIAKMNYEAVVPSEEDEIAFVELVEYVRMAVILIYQDLAPQQEVIDPSAADRYLH